MAIVNWFRQARPFFMALVAQLVLAFAVASFFPATPAATVCEDDGESSTEGKTGKTGQSESKSVAQRPSRPVRVRNGHAASSSLKIAAARSHAPTRLRVPDGRPSVSPPLTC